MQYTWKQGIPHSTYSELHVHKEEGGTLFNTTNSHLHETVRPMLIKKKYLRHVHQRIYEQKGLKLRFEFLTAMNMFTAVF
jgi:hypothetical protein